MSSTTKFTDRLRSRKKNENQASEEAAPSMVSTPHSSIQESSAEGVERPETGERGLPSRDSIAKVGREFLSSIKRADVGPRALETATKDAQELLGLAAAITEPGGRIDTTTLVLAYAEADRIYPDSGLNLHNDLQRIAFAKNLLKLGVLTQISKTHNRGINNAFSAWDEKNIPEPSPSMIAGLRAVNNNFQNDKSSDWSAQSLVRTMLSMKGKNSTGRLPQLLEKIGLEPADLLDALNTESADPEGDPSDPSGKTRTDTQQDVPWLGLTADRAELEVEKDLLGRKSLALGMARLMNSIWQSQNPPKSRDAPHAEEASYVIQIDAPWGEGKTTFANFVAGYLSHGPAPLLNDEGKPYPAWSVIRINAWQSQHVDPPWWNFYLEIIRQYIGPTFHYRGPIGFFRRHWLWINEFRWRLFGPGWVSTFIVYAAVSVAALAVYTYLAPLVDTLSGIETEMQGLLKTFLGVILGSGVLVKFFSALSQTSHGFVERMSGRNMALALGEADPLGRFREHFSRMMRVGGKPVVVIVDDLDRCEASYVVNLLRGLLTVFRSSQVVFMLLGDRYWIETCFNHVFKDMQTSHRDTSHPFGSKFAEKAIRLSFLLPQPSDVAKEAYLKEQLRMEDEEPTKFADNEIDQQLELDVHSSRKEVRETSRELAAERLGGDSDEERQQRLNDFLAAALARQPKSDMMVRHRLMELRGALPANPRRVKRIVNLVTMYQISARAQGIDPTSDDWVKLAAWIILMAEEPLVWARLCVNPATLSEFASDAESNAGRILRGGDPAADLLFDSDFIRDNLWPLTPETRLPSEVGSQSEGSSDPDEAPQSA